MGRVRLGGGDSILESKLTSNAPLEAIMFTRLVSFPDTRPRENSRRQRWPAPRLRPVSQ